MSSLTDNSVYIILGAALAIRSQYIYEAAMSKLTDTLPYNFNEASDKRDPLVHQLLEIAFHGAILSQKVDVMVFILKYGKRRRFLMSIP